MLLSWYGSRGGVLHFLPVIIFEFYCQRQREGVVIEAKINIGGGNDGLAL
jgi:hypothetical protein